MAQTHRRMIYLKIWESIQFNLLNDREKLMYIGMLTLADDDGRLIGKPSFLRSHVFPYDEEMEIKDAKKMRDDIVKSGLITMYTVSGVDYLQHPKWEEYQIIRKDLYKTSSLPSRNDTVTKPVQKSRVRQVKSRQDKITNAPTKVDAPFNWKTEKEKWLNDKQKHIRIIAWFFDEKDIWRTFENSKQVSIAAKRHFRSAKQIADGAWTKKKLKEIVREFRYNDVLVNEWTLETVLKKLSK